MSAIPSYAADIYTDEAIVEPYEHYRALRELGPVVRLLAQDVIVLGRYADVKAALSAPDLFCSGRGVGMNDVINTFGAGNTLMSDGAIHDRLRTALAHRLTPRALRPTRDTIQQAADDLVESLVTRGSFDAVSDLARALPLSIVPDLVGWPEDGREHLLDWAGATFDFLGPMNGRAQQAVPLVQAMMEFATRTADERAVLPCSAAAEMFAAVDRGELEQSAATALILDYIAPSLDTTISAIGSAIWLFARHPDQWDMLRARPELLANAFNEVIRLESPIRGFSRVLTAADTVGGHDLPANSRVLLLFASANRDERRWHEPDRFDITRDAGGHVGFGYGLHGCAGQGLARLEAQAVLRALLTHVERFEVGQPTRALNNVIRALASLPVNVVPATSSVRPATP
jgi:cytochrome P450